MKNVEMTVIINFKLHTSNFTRQILQLMLIIKILTIRIYFPMMGISLLNCVRCLIIPKSSIFIKNEYILIGVSVKTTKFVFKTDSY